ncbi:MAG: hypothetical protein WCE54_15430 [Ignavibacteriaceae bacterium]
MERRSIEKIAEDLRNIIIKTAVEKYEDASIAGLCAEGAWEAAIDAVRNIDLKEKLIEIKNNLSINN